MSERLSTIAKCFLFALVMLVIVALWFIPAPMLK